MLGTAIVDPLAIEHQGRADALGLLPFSTRMNPDKVTRAITGRLSPSFLFGQAMPAMDISGYEIHIGETIYAEDAQAFSILNGREPDGCISPDSRIFGTYLHGLFEDDAFRHAFLGAARSFHQLAPATDFANWRQKREDSFTRLANTVRESLDLSGIFDWVGLPYKSHGRIESVEQIR